MTTVTVNVHIEDATIFQADKVSDFVALRIGGGTDLFLFSSDQALKLYKAAGEAYAILHGLQAEREAKKELQCIDNNIVSAVHGTTDKESNALNDWNF